MGRNKTMYGQMMEDLRLLEEEEAQRPEDWQPTHTLISYKGLQGEVFTMPGLAGTPNKKHSDFILGYDYIKCLIKDEDSVENELERQGYKVICKDYQ